MKRLLFLDRDGTILIEPLPDRQIDSADKFNFLPESISTLKRIVQSLEFELVLISNQDGLGSASFPRENFELCQNLMLRILESEGIKFRDILIDESLANWNLSTRKPGLGLLQPYLSGDFDLKNSWVIGDRLTDVELAQNLGTKSILLSSEKNSYPLSEDDQKFVVSAWPEIYRLIEDRDRTVDLSRETSETSIKIQLSLDRSEKSSCKTGLAFLDHMLDQIARHSGGCLLLEAKGDLEVDEHHLVEDCGIALGEALKAALAKKKCIERYGFTLPMDDCLATVVLDLGGRAYFDWEVVFNAPSVGGINSQLFKHFFQSLAYALGANIYIRAQAENDHHLIEGIFKAFGRCLRQAIRRSAIGIPSTKGMI